MEIISPKHPRHGYGDKVADVVAFAWFVSALLTLVGSFTLLALVDEGEISLTAAVLGIFASIAVSFGLFRFGTAIDDHGKRARLLKPLWRIQHRKGNEAYRIFEQRSWALPKGVPHAVLIEEIDPTSAKVRVMHPRSGELGTEALRVARRPVTIPEGAPRFGSSRSLEESFDPSDPDLTDEQLLDMIHRAEWWAAYMEQASQEENLDREIEDYQAKSLQVLEHEEQADREQRAAERISMAKALLRS